MKIERKSPITGETNTMDLDVTATQYARWLGGELIQDAMPQLSADEREFIISGCMPGEFDSMFEEYE